MDNLLIISYDSGKMIIDMNVFFPCGKDRFIKLLNIIKIVQDEEDKEEIIELLKVYFQYKIFDLIEQKKEHSKKYYDLRQRIADIQEIVNRGKLPKGIYAYQPTKGELQQAEKDLKKYKSALNTALSDVKRDQRHKERFEKHIIMLLDFKF